MQSELNLVVRLLTRVITVYHAQRSVLIGLMLNEIKVTSNDHLLHVPDRMKASLRKRE
jgi:hypothetical protein